MKDLYPKETILNLSNKKANIKKMDYLGFSDVDLYETFIYAVY